MEENENNPSEAVTENPEGKENVDDSVAAPSTQEVTEAKAAKDLEDGTISLDELNATLGRKFQTKEGALKSLKDTQKYVGTKEDDVASKLRESGEFMSRAEFETEMFYSKNEEYAQNREIIDALAVKHNKAPHEVVQMDTYKGLAEKVKGYEESQAKKSVLETNPRLGQAHNTMSSAREAAEKARQAAQQDDVGSAMRYQGEAEKNAVKAVMEAYDL